MSREIQCSLAFSDLSSEKGQGHLVPFEITKMNPLWSKEMNLEPEQEENEP